MASTTRMKLEGVAQLQAALAELPNNLQKPAMRRALVDAAQPMAEDAANLAPVHEGDLRDGYKARTTITKRQSRFARRPGKDEVRAFVGTNYSKTGAGYAPHAHLVEFGTGPRYQKDGTYTGEMPAQPHLRPAFDRGKQGVIERLGEALAAQISKAAKRAARKALKAKR